MEYYNLKFFGLERKLPLIPLTPKIKIASVSLLGDVELTELAATKLAEKIGRIDFDYLVGPEVKVVPLLLALSQKLGKKHFVVCRKERMGYMISPEIFRTSANPRADKLVLDGSDAARIRGKKVIIVDDVVSSGKTITNLTKLLEKVGVKIVLVTAIFKQHKSYQGKFVYLKQLPLFTR